ncbi:MAG: YggT family protein [Acidimicrobiales bacterium]
MNAICAVLNLYVLVIFARVIFSWIRVTPGTPVESIYSVIYSLTEPVLGPIRRAIPPMRMGAAALDLSPIIIIIGVALICR